MSIKELSRATIFGGEQIRFQHESAVNACTMSCSIFLPPRASEAPVPVLYWLSGLTCTDENFTAKAGAQRVAAERQVAIVAPDTSPRGAHVPDDPEGAWDFGLGAGFYVSATQTPWAKNYQMYDYIVAELPALINANFPIDGARQSIFGHSMGGHGALTIALKNPERYQSVSAFAPIASPLNCPWGRKALGRYLGDDEDAWREYDTCWLVGKARDKKFQLRIEQGEADNFLDEQLKPHLLEQACAAADYPLQLERRAGYDHSYYFIATFIGEHIEFHADHLRR